MKCPDCRLRLNPWLDDELDVGDHVALLEHLDACAPCREVFETEARIKERFQETLAAERCPERLRLAFAGSMRRASRFELWRRFLPVVALSAAALLVVAVVPGRNEPEPESPKVRRLRFASRSSLPLDHPFAVHGPLLAFLEAEYDALILDRVRPEEPLGPAHLAALAATGRCIADPESFAAAAPLRFGGDLRIPEAFVAGGKILGGQWLTFEGRTIAATIVGFPDREVVVYDLPSASAPPDHLHDVADESAPAVRFASCPECDVVFVRSKTRNCLLISRQFRDWERPWIYEKARTL